MARSVDGNSIMAAAIWSVAGGVVQQAVTFVIFVVMARLLTPRDFGVMALATAALDILTCLFRAGIPEVIIQSTDASETERSSALFLSVVLGLIASAILLAIAPAIASFYNIPEITTLCRALAVVCILQGLSNTHEGLIKRSMGFKTLTLRLGLATIVSGIIAIILAYNGWGLHALLIQRILVAASLTLLAWFSFPWRPQALPDAKTSLKLLSDGIRISTAATVGFLSNKLLEAVLAFTMGASALGEFRIAWRTIDMAATGAVLPFTSLALPIVARARESAHNAARQLIQLQAGIAYIALPFALIFLAHGTGLVHLVFGDKWHFAGPILTSLSPIVFLSSITSLGEGTLTALKAPNRLLLMAITQLVLATSLAILAAPFGPMAVALSQVVRVALCAALAIALISANLPVISAARRQQWTPLAFALSFEALAIILQRGIFPDADVISSVLFAGCAYLLGLTLKPPQEIEKLLYRPILPQRGLR